MELKGKRKNAPSNTSMDCIGITVTLKQYNIILIAAMIKQTSMRKIAEDALREMYKRNKKYFSDQDIIKYKHRIKRTHYIKTFEE